MMPQNLPVKPAKRKRPRKSFLLSFLGFAFTAGVFLFLAAAAGGAYFLWQLSKDLPDYEKLANYKPPVVTRVHATDGRLIAEFASERRIYVPAQSMPKLLINAFLAAEDQNFFEHNGLDFRGIARAIINNVLKNKKEGASTITQQVAKNFLLTNERSYVRKAKEAILAIRIERAYSKEKILELYLNQIFLGAGSHGVAAASLSYFGKELHQLDIHEVAYLAALPKAPTLYDITKRARPGTENYQIVLTRRNDIINNMVRFGFIKEEEGERAKRMPLEAANTHISPSSFAAEYFAEEVRRSLIDIFGQDENDPNSLFSGGYSVRSTLDPALQITARKALRQGLVDFDRKRGWRGPLARIDVAGDWGKKLADVQGLSDLDPWRLGVVLQTAKDKAVIGLQPARFGPAEVEKERKTIELSVEGMKWALHGKGRGKTQGAVSDVLQVGDVVYISPPSEFDQPVKQTKAGKTQEVKPPAWQLMQVPQVGGAMVVMDPHTGRVLALVGGFSFAESQFDRVMQARRQPGSSFKPIVYAAALDNGYTPASIVNDSVITIEQGHGQDAWKPSNYDKQIHGPQPLRIGIEKSRNLMTVRLAQDLGMPIVSEYSRRFGVYDDLPPLLSMALGAGETTLLRLTAAYCVFANGGKKIQPTLIDRIQDRYGQTIWRHDRRKCEACNAPRWEGQEEPQLADDRPQIIDPMTAYQITSMLEGVVVRGTGSRVWKMVGKPLAGKTGTTNDEKDAWFIGYSPDLAVGIFIGFDNPQPMGRGETGGELAAPIFGNFFKTVLANKPAVPFRVPPGLKQVRVNKMTGLRTAYNDPDAITEYFKPGTEPPETGYDSGVSGVYQSEQLQQSGWPPGGAQQQAPGGWSSNSEPPADGWGTPTPTRPNNAGGTIAQRPVLEEPAPPPTSPYGRRQPEAGGLY